MLFLTDFSMIHFTFLHTQSLKRKIFHSIFWLIFSWNSCVPHSARMKTFKIHLIASYNTLFHIKNEIYKFNVISAVTRHQKIQKLVTKSGFTCFYFVKQNIRSPWDTYFKLIFVKAISVAPLFFSVDIITMCNFHRPWNLFEFNRYTFVLLLERNSDYQKWKRFWFKFSV